MRETCEADNTFSSAEDYLEVFARCFAFQLMTIPVFQWCASTRRYDRSLKDFIESYSTYLAHHTENEDMRIPLLQSSDTQLDLIAYIKSWGLERLLTIGWGF